MALAMPPPDSPTGFGVWVKKRQIERARAFDQQVDKNGEQRNDHQNRSADRERKSQLDSWRGARG